MKSRGKRRRKIQTTAGYAKKRRTRRRLHRFCRWMKGLLLYTAAVFLLCLTVQLGIRFWKGFQAQESAETFHHAEDQESCLVVLDAGHGGKDQGTSYGNILEKEINLEVVLMVREKLMAKGIPVLLTREDDSSVELEDRAALANRENAEIFVSIHCNYCEDDAGVQGMECYHMENSAGGQQLAEQLEACVEAEEEIVFRGIRISDFRVLRKTEMPAVLIELGYLSNDRERNLLTKSAYQEKLADCIAESLEDIIWN